MAIAALPQQVCRFRCLGPAQLVGVAGDVLPFRTRKQIALLLFLARRAGRPIARDELIDLLWSADSEKAARHSLSQSISLINKSMGLEAIETAGRDRLVLRADALWLDVSEFESLASSGEHEAAMKLWRGTLLEGVWVQRAPNFERWLSEERGRLQRGFRRMAHTRLEALRVAGEYATMREESERLLQYDALDEKAMLVHLEALTLLDDRTLALHRYKEFETRLRLELSAEPGTHLRSWAKRIRAGDALQTAPRLTVLPRISEATVLPVPVPLFGRKTESSLLWKAWENAQTGRGSFVIVEGEPGVGKTALVTKLATQAHVSGASVAYVRCYRAEKAVPFAPVTSLVRQLARLPGFLGVDPIWIGELIRLAPELKERFPNAPAPMAVDDAARHRMSDATIQAAVAIADEQPLLLAVDDLQDADEASLALIHYLARQLEATPLLMVGVRRSGQPPATDYEKQFFDTAASLGLGRFLFIKPLALSDARELVERVLARQGRELSADLILHATNLSEGYPLRAIEAALGMRSSNSQQVSMGSDEDSRATSFAHSASTRLARLSAEARLVAATIAIAGRPLTEFELAAATALQPTSLAVAVMSLEEALLVGRRGVELSFVHEAYSATAENSASEPERRRVHLRLAQLSTRSELQSPAARCEAARHLAAAGRARAAIKHALAAAEYAGSIGAIRSRADSLELVIANDRSSASLRHVSELASCYVQLGEGERLATLYEQYREREGTSISFRKDMKYCRLALHYDNATSDLSHILHELEVLVGEPGLFDRWADAQILLTRVADKTGDFPAVHHAARCLRSVARSKGLAIPHALFATGYVIAKYYAPKRAIHVFEDAVRQAERERHWPLALIARDCVAIVLKQVGRYRDSIASFNYSLALARKTMNQAAEMRSLLNRAVSEMALGDYELAEETLLSTRRFAGDVITRGYCTYNLGAIALLSGNYAKSLSCFRACIEEAEHLGATSLVGDAYAAVAMAQQRLGDVKGLCDAIEHLNRIKGAEPGVRIGFMPVAAKAWFEALVMGRFESGVEGLRKHALRMARRDVALWLAIEYEIILLIEWKQGVRADTQRDRLAHLAKHFEAAGVLRDVQNPGDVLAYDIDRSGLRDPERLNGTARVSDLAGT